MSAPPIGMIIITPKSSEIARISGKRGACARDADQDDRGDDGHGQQREIDEVLALDR